MNPATLLAQAYISASWVFGRRGLYPFTRLVKRVFPKAANAERRQSFGDGSFFLFPAGDPYWLSVFETGRPFEPEMEHLTKRLIGRPTLFVDCGANFGFWSVRNASRLKRVVAIEASSETYAWLERNRQANNNGFTTLHAAISDGSEDRVFFETDAVAHASRSIVKSRLAGVESVPAITIDSIVAQHAGPNDVIFVKLDVEGAEVAAFSGAEETFKRESVFLYEDHGKDSGSVATAYLLERGRLVYHLNREGVLRPMKNMHDVSKVKKSSRTSYNFITTGSRFSLFSNMNRSGIAE